MSGYNSLCEAIRKQRVLFFAICGLKGAGELKEDERMGFFEMAGDIANQLEEVRAEMEKTTGDVIQQNPTSTPGECSLTYQSRDCTVTRRLNEDFTLSEVVEQIIFLLQGEQHVGNY